MWPALLSTEHKRYAHTTSQDITRSDVNEATHYEVNAEASPSSPRPIGQGVLGRGQKY